MKNSGSIQILLDKLDEYKSKYYKNLLIKGVLFTLALLLSSFLFVNTLEYFGRFNSVVRGVLFFSFLAILGYSIIFWILKPILFLLNIRQPLTYEKAAKDIGRFFPEIGDRLLNTLQLASFSDKDNSLLEAGIRQKTQELRFVKFADAVNISENKKYLKYVLPPLLLIVLIAAVTPKFFGESSKRIVNFRNDFAEEAPFKFQITNKDLKAVKNEDYTLNLSLIGNATPEAVFLVYNDRKFKMTSKDGKNYNFTFTKVQNTIDFNFLASGFKSNPFELSVINRPNLLSFDVQLNYPSYLNKSAESFNNVGNLVVPEGTVIQWNLRAVDTDSLYLSFDNEPKHLAKDGFGDRFSYERRVKNSSPYQIRLKNGYGSNRENIDFYINVIPDKYPQIQLEQLKDTTLYSYIVLGGNISDDYGISQLKLFYKPIKDDKASQAIAYTSIDIPFNKSQISQSFYYQLPLTTLNLNPSDKVEYFLQVWDNDGVNGAKSTKTQVMTFALPSAKNIDQDVEKANEKTENMMEKILEKSKKLKNELNNLEDRLKSKKDLDFQEKKQLEDLLKKREDLVNQMKELQQQFEATQEKQNRFQPPSPEMQKKMEQLKTLMNELLNDENQKMYDELKKMLEKDLDEKSLEQLEKLKNKERNMDRDIDRTLKLFKQLQLQQKVEKVAKDLEKLAEKQDNLAEKTEKDKDAKTNEDLKKEQEKLNKEFQDQKDALKEIEKMSKEMKKDVDTNEKEQNETQQEQQNAKEQLEQKENQGASKSQKKAAKSMRNMSSKMSESMKSSEMKEMDEDIDALRDILENLVSLSFDQERIMKDFKNMTVTDPRFLKLSQEQLKLEDDAKVVEDSLYSLAKRVLQIKSFVTREVTNMKGSMDESVKFIKERKLNLAASKQQFSMTAVNNLALMLSDVFKQMQAMMAMAMPGSGKGGKNGKKPSPQSMGEMQQKLNEKIDQLSKGGKNGRSLSEELSKLANEQSELRRRLQEMQDDMKGTELGKKMFDQMKDLQKKMDESETDLVNKRINPELINRQRDIQVRLLEAEKAIQQQEEDPTRTSQTGKQFNRQAPPSMEKFLAEKQKQVELIRSVPPNYTPFYKQQTDNYFRKIK